MLVNLNTSVNGHRHLMVWLKCATTTKVKDVLASQWQQFPSSQVCQHNITTLENYLQLKKHNCTNTSQRERECAVTDCLYVSFQLFTAVIDKLLVFYQVSATCSGWMFRSFGGNYSIFRVTVWFTWMLKSRTCNHCMVHKPKRRPASAFVILNYVQSLPGENTILTIFTLRAAMNSHVSHNLQLPYF
jgi:hypothetical protein